MLTYEYIESTVDGSVFAYYPENTKAQGKVIIESAGKGKVLTESPEDIGKRYAFHAIKGIDPNRKHGTVAWY